MRIKPGPSMQTSCFAPEGAAKTPFCNALSAVLKFEGGLNSDPLDAGNRGGNSTNFGITQPVYDTYRKRAGLPPMSTKQITLREVEEIYYQDYWKRSGADQLPEPLSLIHFDTAVNLGGGRASRMLSEASEHRTDLNKISKGYLDLRESFYHRIAENGSNSRFLKGWLNRVNHLRRWLND